MGLPRLLVQSGKVLHSGCIFLMGVCIPSSHSGEDACIIMGSKDKRIAMLALRHLNYRHRLWRSNFHSAKVGSICFLSAPGKPLVASAPNNGLMAMHDDTLPEVATDMNTKWG